MERTFEFDTPQHLRVRTTMHTGSIEIATHDLPSTRVELHPIAPDPRSQRAVDAARAELRDASGRPEVFIRTEGRLRGGGGGVRIVITCPTGSDLDLTAGHGDVRAEGAYGAVRVRGGSGDIRLGALGGESVVRSGRGDIAVERALRRLSVRVGSGDVEIGEGRSLDLAAGNGSLAVRAVGEGELRLHSGNGDIAVGVRPGALLQLDTRTGHGTIQSELDVADTPGGDTIGLPKIDLSIRTGRGDITIRRAEGYGVAETEERRRQRTTP